MADGRSSLRPAARLRLVLRVWAGYPAARVRLALRVWAGYAAVREALWRHPLPEAVQVAGRARRPPPRAEPTPRLSRAVDRCLRLGPWQAGCLTASLVLLRLLRAQGAAAELVIGLPEAAPDHRAHAWVEVGGRVAGPPPGRNGHVELVRYVP